MSGDCLSVSGDEVLVAVRVVPRSPHPGLGPIREGRLLVRVSAAPVDGAANKAVVKQVAKHFGAPPSRARVLRGIAARDKLIAIAGIEIESAHGAVRSLCR